MFNFFLSHAAGCHRRVSHLGGVVFSAAMRWAAGGCGARRDCGIDSWKQFGGKLHNTNVGLFFLPHICVCFFSFCFYFILFPAQFHACSCSYFLLIICIINEIISWLLYLYCSLDCFFLFLYSSSSLFCLSSYSYSCSFLLFCSYYSVILYSPLSLLK